MTVIDESDSGAPVFAWVVRKVDGNQFTFRTSLRNVEVSWQVTGIRRDAWAEKNRIPTEVQKPADERGTYLHPEVFNQPRERGLAGWMNTRMPRAADPTAAMTVGPFCRERSAMRRITRTMLALIPPLAGASPAHAQMGPNLDLTWNTIDGGGGVSSGGGFELIGAIGQPDAGTASGGVFEVAGGFLGGSGGPPPCYPDCNGVGGLTIADFGCFQTKFVAGDPYANCNGVGGLTIADFGCFQTKFVAGCP